MTIAKQLALVLVKEIIADKKNRHVVPDYALRNEVTMLVGFNSTIEQDMFRIETLRSLGIKPYVMPYRDFENKRTPSQYEKDLAQYVNKPMIFKTCYFAEFSPRKGFKCKSYLI